MKKTIIMISMALASWSAFAQHDHGPHDQMKNVDQKAPMFKDEDLGDAYGKYIELKNALVASNPIEAQNASAHLLISLQELKNADKAFAAAKIMAETAKLKDQRLAFVDLSNEIVDLVKGGKIMMGDVYLDYCPMANSNNGAYWLSNEGTISNPYFGDKMLKCGSVKEKL